MPELPEVETVAAGVHKRTAGDVIESVWIASHPQLFRTSAAQEVARMLEHARIARSRRVGKHIVIDLEDPAKPQPRGQWIVHLGMTGNLLVVPAEAELAKHTHLIAKLQSGRELRFVDPRRFGKLSVIPAEQAFTGPGAEPLEISLEQFVSLFRGRKSPIKAALLNQKLLHGVGNIYADEALFRAGIRPRRRACSLTRAELARLRESLQEVLTEAIAAGGTTISDHVDADGNAGFFDQELRAYGRTGEPCLRCKTPIKRIVVGGRSTHYCPKCQK